MIWQAMYGSGWRIGMMKIIMEKQKKETRWDQLQDIIASCVAVRGTAFLTFCVSPIVAGTVQIMRTSAAAFAVPARPDSGILGSGFLKF